MVNMQKLEIKNRQGEKLAVLIEKAVSQKNLVFIMHGLGEFKERPQMETLAKTFKDNHFTVVRFDTTNSIGESAGKLENATATNYYQDLEDVTLWAKTQDWYQEPFWLAGHSLGGFCIAFFAANQQKKVKAVAPISTFVSGKLFSQTKEIKALLKEWKEKGMREWEGQSKPGLIKRLKYGFMEDSFKYDLLKVADKIKCPVLLIVGEDDEITPLKYQKLLFKKLRIEKELHVIKGAEHTFDDKKSLRNLESIIKKWMRKII